MKYSFALDWLLLVFLVYSLVVCQHVAKKPALHFDEHFPCCHFQFSVIGRVVLFLRSLHIKCCCQWCHNFVHLPPRRS
jgi:hypothetical protein